MNDLPLKLRVYLSVGVPVFLQYLLGRDHTDKKLCDGGYLILIPAY